MPALTPRIDVFLYVLHPSIWRIQSALITLGACRSNVVGLDAASKNMREQAPVPEIHISATGSRSRERGWLWRGVARFHILDHRHLVIGDAHATCGIY